MKEEHDCHGAADREVLAVHVGKHLGCVEPQCVGFPVHERSVLGFRDRERCACLERRAAAMVRVRDALALRQARCDPMPQPRDLCEPEDDLAAHDHR